MANGIWGWSTTSASNATQDSINFAEGQAPSTVNDSARGLMSIVAKFLDDLGGGNAGGGSANAQTVTTATGLSSYGTGMLVAWKAGYTNTSAATLNVDGVGAKNIYLSGTALAGGEIVAGGVHVAAYDATLNSSAGGWHLLNPATLPTAAITSGTINGATVGATTPAAGAFTDLKATEGFSRSGIISPAQITADQNDYAPTDFDTSSVIRLTSDAARTITGLIAPTTNPTGREMCLINIGSHILTLGAESASSTAANRFAAAGDILIQPGGGVLLIYDSTSSRWRPRADAGQFNASMLAAGTIPVARVPTGMVIDRVYTEYRTATSITAVIPLDNTIPQSTEGTQILTASITPKTTTNRVRARAVCWGSRASATTLIAALFLDAETGARAASADLSNSNGACVVIEYEFVPATTSTITIAIRVGVPSGECTINGQGGSRLFGGASLASLVLEEIVA